VAQKYLRQGAQNIILLERQSTF